MLFLNSISKKVMLGYAAILVLLILTALWLHKQTTRVNNSNQVLIDTTLPALKSIEKISIDVGALQLAAYSLYGTTINKSQFDEEFVLHTNDIDKQMKQFNTLQMTSTQATQSKLEEFTAAVSNIAQTMGANTVNWDAARVNLSEIAHSSDLLREELHKLQEQIEKEAATRAKGIDSQLSSIQTLVPIFLIIIASITVFAYLLARSTIINPIKLLSKQLDHMAAQHDLQHNIDIASEDEVGTAAKSVNEVISAFRKGNLAVRESTNTLLGSVQKLNDSASTSDTQVEVLSRHLNELLDGISTLESSIENGAQRSENASDAAKEGAEQVKSGAQNVQLTSSSIAELAQNIEISANKLVALQNAGDQVSSVVRTIADIAEQTNLLALNAAIEAARAGESGRGFAVVADEVRTLASRTHDSTHEINSILESIVSSISETVEQMESNSQKAKTTVDLAESTVQSLATIEQSVMHLSQENHDLAIQSQQTMNEAGAMRSNIDEIQSVAEKVTCSSRQTRSASDALAGLAASLNDVASTFKS